MRDEKPYCKEGESESYIALAWVILGCPVIIMAWFFLLWVIGVIDPQG